MSYIAYYDVNKAREIIAENDNPYTVIKIAADDAMEKDIPVTIGARINNRIYKGAVFKRFDFQYCDVEYFGKKKLYFHLPCDQYGQPNGLVVPEYMTKYEYLVRSALSREFIFSNYRDACARAAD